MHPSRLVPQVRLGPMSLPVTPRNVHPQSRHCATGNPMHGFVKMEMDDGLAIVTINRPDALTALNAAVLRELSMAIEHLSMAQDVGAIILTGVGDRAFVAGADIKEMANLTGLEMQRFSEMGRRLGATMVPCTQPLIAATH